MASSPWPPDCPGRPPRIKERLRRPHGIGKPTLDHDALPWVCSYQGDGADVVSILNVAVQLCGHLVRPCVRVVELWDHHPKY